METLDLFNELKFMKKTLDKLKKDDKKLKDYIALSKNYFSCYKTLKSLGQEEKSELEDFLAQQ